MRPFGKTEYGINFTKMKIFNKLGPVLDSFPQIECNKLTIGKARLWHVNYVADAYE